MKRCKTCGQNKPDEAFGPHRSTKDKLKNDCKRCASSAENTRRAKIRALKATPLPEPREFKGIVITLDIGPRRVERFYEIADSKFVSIAEKEVKYDKAITAPAGGQNG
jgi:hypothetical protein